MKKLILFFVAMLFVENMPAQQFSVLNQGNACGNNYINPVFEPDLADPAIIRAADGYFYGYGTENTWAEGTHRIVPIVRSKDLVNWKYICDAFTTKPAWKSAGYIWAPCIVYKNDKYYLYYSFSAWGDTNPGIGLAVSSYPYGPFTDLGKIFDSNSIGVGNSIDPFYIETGGNSYLFWGSFRGVYGIQLAADMKTTVGTKFKIAGNMFEATYIYFRNGKYYFFGSSGNCCEGKDSKYRVSVAAADNIKGPYYTKEGISILKDDQEATPFLVGDQDNKWVGPGHNGEIITDNTGRYFIFYHAVDYSDPLLWGGATKRPLLMDQLFWDETGWPYVINNHPNRLLQISPQL
jgi:arabinan endo-1,5-alpha-L-arabinosidase